MGLLVTEGEAAARVVLYGKTDMHATFFQKLILSLIAGAVLGGLVEFYKTFIEGADNALNGKKAAPHSTWGKR